MSLCVFHTRLDVMKDFEGPFFLFFYRCEFWKGLSFLFDETHFFFNPIKKSMNDDEDDNHDTNKNDGGEERRRRRRGKK